jgi:hypothetical protein
MEDVNVGSGDRTDKYMVLRGALPLIWNASEYGHGGGVMFSELEDSTSQAPDSHAYKFPLKAESNHPYVHKLVDC